MAPANDQTKDTEKDKKPPKEKTKAEVVTYLKAHGYKAKDVDDEAAKVKDTKEDRARLLRAVHKVTEEQYRAAGGNL